MKRFAWLIAPLAALALLGPAASADETARTEKKARKQAKAPALRGEHARMASVVGLSQDQQARILQLLQDKNQARKQWQKDNAAQLQTLKQAAKQAKADKNKEEMKKVSAQIKQLTAAQKQIEQKYETEIQAALTAEQRKTWAEHQASAKYLGRFRKANLTDAQQAQMKQIVSEMLGKIGQAGDRKARSTAEKELRGKLMAVLTDEQKAQLQAPRPKRTEKPDKPRRNKPARREMDDEDVDEDDEF